MAAPNSNERKALVELVQYVFQHRDGLIKGVTYETLASWIGRLNKHGIGHGHGMGAVLSRMGHLLQGPEGEWGERIPEIQSLVVQKTGQNRDLPDDGIREFWTDYPLLSRTEKFNRVRVEYQKIVNFGSRWNDVLRALELQPILARGAPSNVRIPYGGSGESAEHKSLKEYIRTHPEIVGAESSWRSKVEYALPSCDQVDVVFTSADTCIAVEVKSSISDTYPFDYERGLYQTIKYAALLSAMRKDRNYSIPTNVKSVLVLESSLPWHVRELAKLLGVVVIENVRKRDLEGN